MNTLVWVESWQFQCCGDPGHVGETVTWDVTDADATWLVRLLGNEWTETIDVDEDHHAFGSYETRPLTGVIRSIRLLTTALEPSPDEPDTYYWSPGGGHLESVAAMDVWAPVPPKSDRGRRSFVGWVVEFEIAGS